MDNALRSNRIRRAVWRNTALPTLEVANRYGTGVVSLYGAHVLSWIPAGGAEVLMLSEKSAWQIGEPIRGGVPVCWPWFGGAAKPSHGIARRNLWELRAAEAEADGSDTVELVFETEEPHPLRATFRVNFGASLRMSLTTLNCGASACRVGGALHTYFAVSDIGKVTLSGLENAGWLDTVGGTRECPGMPGPVVCEAETDRVYHSAAPVLLRDAGWDRAFRIAKEGSEETVVWNPWIEKARRMPDFGDGEYQKMLCVEAANIPGVEIEPGKSHTLTQIVTPA